MALQLPPGSTFEQFRIIREIGRGGMGAVFEVEQQGRLFALKLLSHQDQSSTQRFLREAQLLARVDRHPNIVSIHAFGQSQLGPWFTMDYIQGQSLADLLEEQGPLTPAETKKLATEVASALEFIHSQGISHRDLKAENILIATDGTALLADFGIARAIDSETLTKTGQALGTPHAMAPELLCGEPSGPPADLWALGVLLYQCLTAELPFQGDSMTELAIAIVNRKPKPLPKHIPYYFQFILNSLLAQKPTARMSAEQALIALQNPAHRASISIFRGALLFIFALTAPLVALHFWNQYKLGKLEQHRWQRFQKQSASLDALANFNLETSLPDLLLARLTKSQSDIEKISLSEFKNLWDDLHNSPKDYLQRSNWPNHKRYYSTRVFAQLFDLAPKQSNSRNFPLESLISKLDEGHWQEIHELASQLQEFDPFPPLSSFQPAAIQAIKLIASTQIETHSQKIVQSLDEIARHPIPIPASLTPFQRDALIQSFVYAQREQSRALDTINRTWHYILKSPLTQGPDAAPFWEELNLHIEKMLSTGPIQERQEFFIRWTKLAESSPRIRWPRMTDRVRAELHSASLATSMKTENSLQTLSLWRSLLDNPSNSLLSYEIRTAVPEYLSSMPDSAHSTSSNDVQQRLLLYAILSSATCSGMDYHSLDSLVYSSDYRQKWTLRSLLPNEMIQGILALGPSTYAHIDRLPPLTLLSLGNPNPSENPNPNDAPWLRKEYLSRLIYANEAIACASSPELIAAALNLRRRRIEILINWLLLSPDSITLESPFPLSVPPLNLSATQVRELLGLFPTQPKSIYDLFDWTIHELADIEKLDEEKHLDCLLLRLHLYSAFAFLLSEPEFYKMRRNLIDKIAIPAFRKLFESLRDPPENHRALDSDTLESFLSSQAPQAAQLLLKLQRNAEAFNLIQELRLALENSHRARISSGGSYPLTAKQSDKIIETFELEIQLATSPALRKESLQSLIRWFKLVQRFTRESYFLDEKYERILQLYSDK